MKVYDFTVLDQKKNPVSLGDYQGKVLLIVNTDTRCGLTKQYNELQRLFDLYKEQGFVILDFPCNQFFKQAPEDNEEINTFCSLKFKTSFPRFDKVEVNGKNAIPLFRYLKTNAQGKEVRVKWNFTKFLIDREGNLVSRFEPTMTPNEFEEEIKKLL